MTATVPKPNPGILRDDTAGKYDHHCVIVSRPVTNIPLGPVFQGDRVNLHCRGGYVTVALVDGELVGHRVHFPETLVDPDHDGTPSLNQAPLGDSLDLFTQVLDQGGTMKVYMSNPEASSLVSSMVTGDSRVSVVKTCSGVLARMFGEASSAVNTVVGELYATKGAQCREWADRLKEQKNHDKVHQMATWVDDGGPVADEDPVDPMVVTTGHGRFQVRVLPQGKHIQCNYPLSPLTIATDASFRRGGHLVGVGYATDHGKAHGRVLRESTIFEGECRAVICAVEQFGKAVRKVTVLTDNQGVANIASGRNIPTTPAGKDLVEALAGCKADVHVVWVKGHNGHVLNEFADRCAVAARRAEEFGQSKEARIEVFKSIRDEFAAALEEDRGW